VFGSREKKYRLDDEEANKNASPTRQTCSSMQRGRTSCGQLKRRWYLEYYLGGVKEERDGVDR
jgi:hypothetical protein